jgi:hypothetical protein
MRMDEFDRRRKGFDKFFALSEALRFTALSRRNRVVGEWAAEKLGLAGDASDRYADSFAQPRIEGDTDETLIARLHDAFVKAGVDVSAHRIRRKFEAAMNDAIAEIEAGK